LIQIETLTGLEGLTNENAAERLASAIGVDRTRVRSQLLQRDDEAFVSLLPAASVSSDLGAALAELEEALGRPGTAG
jgi:hypothetical protein